MATGLDNARDQRRFIERLTEAISWCTGAGSLSDPRTSLRTFKPADLVLVSQHDQVFAVCGDRWRALSLSGRRDLPAVTSLCGGRLVAYFPGDSLSDGPAEAESKGFFDVDNIPPYDTWVWMVRNVRAAEYPGTTGEIDANYLVAWVPPDFIDLANRGIEANPEQCIMWLDTLDDEFVQSLRRLNVLHGQAPTG
jgi:hypothetical protein